MKYNSELTIKETTSAILKFYKAMREDIVFNNCHHSEMDDYRTVTFDATFTEFDEPIDYSIEINADYSVIIYRDNNTLSLSDTLYGVVKDLFIPLREKVYAHYDALAVDEDDDYPAWDESDDITDCSNPNYYDVIGLNFA